MQGLKGTTPNLGVTKKPEFSLFATKVHIRVMAISEVI